jgi:hypothetical protein
LLSGVNIIIFNEDKLVNFTKWWQVSERLKSIGQFRNESSYAHLKSMPDVQNALWKELEMFSLLTPDQIWLLSTQAKSCDRKTTRRSLSSRVSFGYFE